MAVYKICNKCGKNKSIKQFYKNERAKDGHRNTCKSCSAVKRRLKNKKNNNPLLNEEVISLMRHHKYTKVIKFGYFYGLLIFLRHKEILAFSLIAENSGSNVFSSTAKAKAFLYKKMIMAGERTSAGLTGGY